jgi:hypothetical protein
LSGFRVSLHVLRLLSLLRLLGLGCLLFLAHIAKLGDIGI